MRVRFGRDAFIHLWRFQHVEHHSIIRPVQTIALAAFMTLGSLFMATGVGAQATPDASPSASPVAVTGTEVDNLGCWADAPDSSVAGYPQWSSQPEMKIDPAKTYIATIETNRGDIVIQLYADVAPNTVNNFICLATEDYYDGVVFHRVMRDFMIQTGDPTGTGRGGPGYQIGDELPGEDLNYVEGSVAMANAGPNTNGSQFFISQANNSANLQKNYTIFGQVIEGMDVVDTIAETPVSPNENGEVSKPAATLTVLDITITEQ
jgi:cyclophilin family peptidyl-prolyl cis-trans isomerase